MDAKVVWNEGLHFTASATSGFKVELDADPSSGGQDKGFRPLEMLAVGLAGCTAMDVLAILRKKRQDVTAFDVSVHAAQRDQHPYVFTAAEILYRIRGHTIDETAVLRAIELSALSYCPAQAMFSGVFPIVLRYEIYEDLDGEEKLVKQGVWQAAAN